MKPTIKIDCLPDGTVKIEGRDFAGPDCEKATRFLEEGLGTVESRVKKPEFYQRNVTGQQQRVGGSS